MRLVQDVDDDDRLAVGRLEAPRPDVLDEIRAERPANEDLVLRRPVIPLRHVHRASMHDVTRFLRVPGPNHPDENHWWKTDDLARLERRGCLEIVGPDP